MFGCAAVVKVPPNVVAITPVAPKLPTFALPVIFAVPVILAPVEVITTTFDVPPLLMFTLPFGTISIPLFPLVNWLIAKLPVTLILPATKFPVAFKVPATLTPVPVTTNTFALPATLVLTLPFAVTMTLLLPFIICAVVCVWLPVTT